MTRRPFRLTLLRAHVSVPTRRSRLNLQSLEDRTVPANYPVTTTADSGSGSLRDAIAQSNANPPAAGRFNTIDFEGNAFAGSATITLASALPTITADLQITGTGVADLTVDGGGHSQVFNTTANNLTLSGFTVADGLASNSNGGGLEVTTSGTNRPNVVIDHMAFTNNKATGDDFGAGSGGAIGAGLHTAMSLNVTDTTISGSTAQRDGGGIYFYGNGLLVLTGSTVSGNQTTDASTNGTYYIGGGGIYFFGRAASFQIVNSTIADNVSAACGGGIELSQFSGTAVIQDSTICGNAANTTASGYGGGGIYGGPILIQNSVVSGNTSRSGPDIYQYGVGTGVKLYASAVGSKLGFTPSGGSYLVGEPGTLGLDTNLTNNGGPTETLNLLPGSELIDAGDNSLLPAGTSTDQRGFVRVYNGTIDIGAVESQPAGVPLVTSSPSNVTDADTGAASYQFTVTYSDPNGTNNGIRAASFVNNDSAVTVTGPNGFSASATYMSADFTTDGTPRTVTYQITPPAGSWGFAADGTYTVHMQAGEVFDLDNNSVQPGALATFNVTITPSQPLASANGPDVNTAGAASYQFTVTYSDPNGTNNGIRAASFVNNDGAVTVTGPNGFSAPAAYVSADVTTDGTPRTVTYQITPPGGGWGSADDGTYTVDMQANQVLDLDNNPVDPGPIGTFDVNIPLIVLVTNDDDSGQGSLRDAITEVDAHPGSAEIDFDPAFFGTPRTIALQTALPDVPATVSGLTIVGPGAGNLTVDAGDQGFRVFNSYAQDLTMSGITITGGVATNDIGGGLAAAGNVTLDHMVFTGNSATGTTPGQGGGGAVALRPGDNSLLIVDTTISGNTATLDGGGVYVGYLSGPSAGLKIEGSTISGNSATFDGTRQGFYGGGGVFVSGTPGYFPPPGFAADAFTIVNSTIANNTTSGAGGGVWGSHLNGTLQIQDSTISGNTAATAGSYSYIQGSVHRYYYGGGGVGALTGPYLTTPTLTIQNSVISGNTGPADPDIGNPGNTNLYSSAVGSADGFTPSVSSTGNLPFGTPVLLGPLQDNGGLTFTLAPETGSPLLGGGGNVYVPAGLTTDQRGFGRTFPAGGNVDIGAVEAQPSIPTVAVDPTQVSPTNDPSAIKFDVTFDQPVTGFDPAQVSLAGSTATGSLVANVTLVDAYRYTVTVTGVTGDGTVDVGVLAGTGPQGLNASGQNNAASAASASVTVDTTPPTVTVNQDGSQHDPTNTNPIVFDVQFSEPVLGFDASKVTLGGTLASFASITGFNTGAGPNSWVVDVTVSGSHTGTVTASAGAGVVTDLAGNPNKASTSTDNTVTFDDQSPTVTVAPAAGQGNPGGGIAVAFAVTFSEPVVGFTVADINTLGTTAPGASFAVTDSGDHTNFTVTATGMTAAGTVALTIDPGVVADPAGNDNTGSNTSSITYVHSGTVQFSAPTYAINEQGAPTLQVVVTRTGGSDGALSVDYTTADGTAVHGTNYTTESGTLTWTAGDTTSQTIDIPILDAGPEPDSTFTVNLSNTSPTGALGSPSTATVTIDAEAALGFSAATYNTAEGDGFVTVTVHRLFDSTGAVSVDYATGGGTATAGSDYTAETGTLTWADGDNTDKTFTVPIIDDTLSEGKETINLTLSNATGNALLGAQSTATITIAASDGTTVLGAPPKGQKSSSTFTDADGDLVTITLGGRVGSLTYYQTNGTGPISEIDLTGTDPTKSTVSITVKKPRGGTGDGRVGIGEVDGTGFRTFTAKTGDLDGAGFNLSGFAGSITVGNVSNGADFLLAGAVPTSKSATSITAGVIGDGTDVTVAAPVKSISATAVGQGTITAPSVGSIKVKGRKATKTLPAVSGDFKSDVMLSGAGVDLIKGKTLGSLSVAGAVSGAAILVTGNVGSISVGSFVDSELFVGYTGPTDGSGTFMTNETTVGPFTVKAATAGFVDSYVIAWNFKSVSLASVDTGNGGVPFGFDFHGSAGGTFGGLTVKNPKLIYNKKTGGTQVLQAEFEVKKV